MTHASRDTTTGLLFEQYTNRLQKEGINISKKKFCSFLESKGIDNVLNHLSWRFEPDEAYYLPNTNEIIIYEKKTQHTAGSADEKLGSCGWKITEYKDACAAIGINKVSYIYCFSSWFRQPRYTKLLKYIRSIDGCDYFFKEVA